MECVALHAVQWVAVVCALHDAVCNYFQCVLFMHYSVHFGRFQYSAFSTFQCRAGCTLQCIAEWLGGCGTWVGNWGSGGDLSVAATVSIRLVSYPPNISYTNS